MAKQTVYKTTRQILFFGADSDSLEASLKGYEPKGKLPFEVVSAAAIGVSHKYPKMCWPESVRAPNGELDYVAFVVDSAYMDVEDVVGALRVEDVPLIVTQGTIYKEIDPRDAQRLGIDRVLNPVETLYRPGPCIDEVIESKRTVKA